MDSAAREAPFMSRRDTDESRCPMVLLPPETKIQIMSYIRTQQSLSRLAQSCGAWYGPATQELYTRDAKRHRSFAIKWMAAHAVDEQTTEFALRTLETSRRWGGQIDAFKPFSQRDVERLNEDQIMYKTSTALHFAVVLGNMRLAKTLLDMKASLKFPCSNWLRESMGSEEVLQRASYFFTAFKRHGVLRSCTAFPIFLAFLQRDADMCRLLVDYGAGREAMILNSFDEPKIMSILHFAAVDPTTDYRHWKFLFDRFREYINEPSPRASQLTPLHAALMVGCTQGMQIAVETGADKEARNGDSRTPLSIGVLGISNHTSSDPRTVEECTMCFRKFVELGASVNPEGDSVLLHAVQSYAPYASSCPGMRHVIYFLLEHNADIHATSHQQDTNLVNEIVQGIIDAHDRDPETEELLKELLSDLVDRGLNLTTPAPGLDSPLHSVLDSHAKPEWLFDLLCEKSATIHEHEVSGAFMRWSEIPRLWRTNKYDAWWQYQGQEDEMFLKWCEGPYNAWWCQHVEQISPLAVREAFQVAFNSGDRQLYDILTHLPLPVPTDGLLSDQASASFQIWSWMQVVLRVKNFVATWYLDHGDNMIHVTVHIYSSGDFPYSAAHTIQDILYLRDKGVDMTCRNASGKTPLDILLESGRSRDGFMEVAAVLEGNAPKVRHIDTSRRTLWQALMNSANDKRDNRHARQPH